MNLISCNRCGTKFETRNLSCPSCGHPADTESLRKGAVADPREEAIRDLLEQARDNARNGDLSKALCIAREALVLQNDCSMIHALLGQLYEQQGDDTAAQYHFQTALEITTCTEDETPLPLLIEPPRASRHAGVIMLVLIGCILFSGLAALISFQPKRDGTELGSIQYLPGQLHRSENPRWTWRVPTPMPLPAISEQIPATTTTQQIETAVSHTPDAGTNASSSIVLGPAAHHHSITTAATGSPSLAAADQAFIHEEFDTAATLFEAVLAGNDNPHPRIYRDLAWCYQQLGNSAKATEYLTRAIQGYRTQLEADAYDTAAQQGLKSCSAALNSLMTTHIQEKTTP